MFQDMTFALSEKNDILIGQPFDVALKVNNKCNLDRNVKITLTATSMYYTGVPVKVVKSETYNIKAAARASM